MIVGYGAYRDGKRIDGDGESPFADTNGTGVDFAALAEVCVAPDFAWVGLLEPDEEELASAAAAFGIHPLAAEDALTAHERPKVDVYGDTLTVILRPARYLDDLEVVEFGQLTMMASPRHIIVVRHRDAVPLTDLRARMESDPAWLAQGPGAVMHAITDVVVEAYLPVLEGIADDIEEVEDTVFAPDAVSPAQRIYDLKREVLEFGKAVIPLDQAFSRLVNLRHPVLNDELRRYFADTGDDIDRVVDQITTNRELLTSVLDANLTQVSVRQNEDMRKISAWVAILAVPTMIAGIYGMNFDHMPELDTRYGYYVVLALIASSSLYLYWRFKKSGWL